MKAFKRMLCLALVAMMLCAAALPACAATKTVYLSSKGGNSEWFWVSLGKFKTGARITDVKSSNKKIVKLTQMRVNQNSYTKYEKKKSSGKGVYVDVSGRAYKAGSANITYKLNGKSQKQAVKVLGYVNPVRILTFSGISNKNLKSLFDRGNYAYGDTLQKDVGAGFMTLCAASGWKIETLFFEDYSAGEGEVDYTYSSWGEPVSNVKVHLPALKAGVRYRLYANFINTKNKGTRSISYDIEPNYYDDDDDY